MRLPQAPLLLVWARWQRNYDCRLAARAMTHMHHAVLLGHNSVDAAGGRGGDGARGPASAAAVPIAHTENTVTCTKMLRFAILKAQPQTELQSLCFIMYLEYLVCNRHMW